MEETIQHAEVIEVTLERKIETALVRHNVTDAVIQQLKAKYGGLKLAALDDKESYLEIKQAAKDCAKLRNLAAKVCKEGREEALKIQKLWVSKQNEVVAKIEQIEKPLDEEIAKYDAEVERKKNEERQRQEDEYMRRTQLLTKMGATYTDGCFCIGDFSIEANLVKESSIDVWEESMLPKFEKEYQQIEAERIEKERIEKERKEKERKEREEFEQKQADFKRQQEEFQRKQQELELEGKRKAQEMITRRCNQLQSLGMSYSFQYDAYVFDDVNVDNKTEISLLSDGQWDELVEKVRPAIEQRKKEAEERRIADIEKQKHIAAEAAAQQERERIAEEQRQAEIKRQQEEARKAEELAKAGDKAKWEHFIEEIKKVSVPSCKSGQYRNAATIAQQKLDEILNLTPKIK